MDEQRAREDQSLVAAAKQGDPRAFGELARRYRPRIFHVALGVLKNRADAEDAAQQALLKAHQGLATFQGTSSFSTWLYRITMNVCIDLVRRAGRHGTTSYDEEAQGPTETRDRRAKDPAQVLSERELAEKLEVALAQLGEMARAVLLLREFDDLSYELIADVLDVAQGTVMSRLHYARQRMQELLAEYLGMPVEPTRPVTQEDGGGDHAEAAVDPRDLLYDGALPRPEAERLREGLTPADEVYLAELEALGAMLRGQV